MTRQVLPATAIRTLHARGVRATITLDPRAGTPVRGQLITDQRGQVWQVLQVLRDAGLVLGAAVEAEQCLRRLPPGLPNHSST
ncbi:hypothetical protein [Deinococcus sonorensis]|uniref:Uncharacterized protein n=2 Tax=Deinococcus sonorensis TaxID=309891 RepID=A0AAU7U8D2_9DEIO